MIHANAPDVLAESLRAWAGQDQPSSRAMPERILLKARLAREARIDSRIWKVELATQVLGFLALAGGAFWLAPGLSRLATLQGCLLLLPTLGLLAGLGTGIIRQLSR